MQYRRQADEVEAEKHELLMEHTELLKRISSLENRLEEQRRSAVLGASQNLHAEKCRSLSEEKQQLLLIVQEKNESMSRMQEQMSELHQRIDKLMKAALDQESFVRSKQSDFSQSSSIERLRDAPGNQQQDGSMTWSRLQANQSPIPVSPIQQGHHHRAEKQPAEIPLRTDNDAELEELKRQLIKSEEQRRILEEDLASRAVHLDSLNGMLEQAEQDKKEKEELCLSLQEQLGTCRNKLENFETEVQRLEKEIEAARQAAEKQVQAVRTTAEKELADQMLAGRTLAEELRKRCDGLEAARNNLLQEYDIVRRRCLALENESTAQRATVSTIEVLQQRCATLQADLIHQQETTEEQCAQLKARLLEKEKAVADLHLKLNASDKCKAQVEHALRQLQQEVDAFKQAQQAKPPSRPVDPKDLSALIEGGSRFFFSNLDFHYKFLNFLLCFLGPAAPPDLLAPSFVEFLGSASSSRSSSRPSSAMAHRTAESITFTDLSLPNSMAGKKMLKDLQKESEELLAFGKQLLELQQKKSAPQRTEDPEATLLPDGISGFEAPCSANEAELAKKVELLEMQLAMERLLLQDQRAANARQQQQVCDISFRCAIKRSDRWRQIFIASLVCFIS